MAQVVETDPASSSLSPPCVVVLLPDGSARLYDDARLTASTVLADFPRHLLLSTLSTATPRTPLPHAADLEPGRTYYLVAETHRPQTAARIDVEAFDSACSDCRASSRRALQKSVTLPCNGVTSLALTHHIANNETKWDSLPASHVNYRLGPGDWRSEVQSNDVVPNTGNYDGQRSLGSYGPVSPLSPLSPYSPALSTVSDGATPIPYRFSHYYGDGGARLPAWQEMEGVGSTDTMQTTCTSDTRRPANPILQELGNFENMTDSRSPNNQQHSPHSSNGQLRGRRSLDSLAQPITAARRPSPKPSLLDKLPLLKGSSFKSRKANTGRKISKNSESCGDIIRQNQEEEAWSNIHDRSVMHTDTQILARRNKLPEYSARVHADTKVYACNEDMYATGLRIFPRHAPSHGAGEDGFVFSHERHHSQLFYRGCGCEAMYA
ncbi:unnamed protein product [Closterium sp. Yama58-4]|nr:unnamed protein product [Closterium sp. Yama58-4]